MLEITYLGKIYFYDNISVYDKNMNKLFNLKYKELQEIESFIHIYELGFSLGVHNVLKNLNQ